MDLQFDSRVKCPPHNQMNTGMRVPTQADMIRLFGEPSKHKTQEGVGSGSMNEPLRSRIVTKDIGPFRATGFDLFLYDWQCIFHELESVNPELHDSIKSAGCLNVRLQRGSRILWSNHAWGMAADWYFGARVDDRGDGFCEKGMLLLYQTGLPRKYGMYWAAEYKNEDSMHWDACLQRVTYYADLIEAGYQIDWKRFHSIG